MALSKKFRIKLLIQAQDHMNVLDDEIHIICDDMRAFFIRYTNRTYQPTFQKTTICFKDKCNVEFHFTAKYFQS